jgi:hypothetical protein
MVKISTNLGVCLVIGITLLTGTAARAQKAPLVESLAIVDRTYMQEQRQRIDELARVNLGRQLHREKAHDLGILQALLDRRLIQPEQTLELQAMGLVMGDILALELELTWVVYEDKYGRSRALRLADTDNFLFPMTMISRRVEAGATVSVQAVYDKAYKMIAPYRKPLPFQ